MVGGPSARWVGAIASPGPNTSSAQISSTNSTFAELISYTIDNHQKLPGHLKDVLDVQIIGWGVEI